jgi:hypothetical protein
MTRFNKFLSLSILVLFILACNTVTKPISDAQNLAGTAQSIASSLPVETLQAMASQIPVETLQALPSSVPTFEALASQLAPIGDMFNPQGTPVSEWNGIPIMSQATTGEDFPDTKSYSFKANATVKEAQDFYKAELEKLGWSSFVNVPSDANGAILIFNKEGSTLTITIAESEGSILVILTMT